MSASLTRAATLDAGHATDGESHPWHRRPPATLLALRAMRPGDAAPSASVFGLTARSISNRLAAMASAAGLEGTFSGHSARVGMARDLVAHGASVAAVQVAGRWESSRMPAHYARGELAARGAVARFHGE